ncbi:MAG: pirin family protein, partial [Thermoplasmata archaeon]|nr:pirin family protein [Thermoplasmata archaeon]
LEDVAGRVLFPSPLQGPWLPFLRLAETVTTGGGDDPGGHSHFEEEVLNYVVDGRVEYEDEEGHRSVLEPGTVELLTAREEARHKLVGLKQNSLTRWLSVVVRCPRSAGEPSHRMQVAPGPIPTRVGEGPLERLLVGPGAAVESGAGLECVDIEFRQAGRCVCPIGGRRRAAAYVYEGSGTVDDQLVEAGAGRLMDNVAKVSIRAESGTRLLLASAPRMLA